MEWLAERLSRIPGVVAVTLGGSRAQGTHRPDSDCDFGLYYERAIDPDDVRAMGYEGTVVAPRATGRIR
jgi:predicted nucleotidyltransferase